MNQTVLFVDDEPNILDGILRSVRHEPYRSLTATSGEQALTLLGKTPVDVVVSDEQMPGMGGLELLTTIHQQYPEIVNVMLSGQASIGTVVRALNHGQLFRFLIKPCSIDELCANIRQALSHKQVLDRCRDILPLFRRQTALLNALERSHPGMIQHLEMEAAGFVKAKRREDAATAKDLSERMEVVIREAGHQLNEAHSTAHEKTKVSPDCP